MKKTIGIIFILALLAIPLSASATIIGNTTLTMTPSSLTGVVTFPGASQGNYYLDYDAVYAWNGKTITSEIFCVENIPGSTSPQPYTLLSLDDTLSKYVPDANRYFAAAWIADNYYNSATYQETWKAAAQIAIWEVIFDYGTYNLGAGNFKSSNNLNDEAQTILNTLAALNQISNTGNWALAVSPVISEGGTVTLDGFQNYLVKNPAPVPEPATMLLLGTGLLGLAGISRKRFKKS